MTSVGGRMRSLWLVFLLAGCKKDDVETADLLVLGNIHMDVETETDAIAVRNGQIVAIGADAQALKGTGTAEVDVGDQHVFPGFHDAHTHLLAGSFAFARLLLLGTPSMEAMTTATVDYASDLDPEEPWVVGYGWLAENIPEPDGRAISEVITDRPVLLVSNSGHEAVVNQFALDLAGITAETPDPPDGMIGRDPDTGEPTGYLVEGAMTAIATQAMDEYDDARLSSALPGKLVDFSRSGLTGVSEILAAPGFDLGRPQIYTALEESGDLPIRVTWYAPLFSIDDFDEIEALRDNNPGELVRFGGAKIWVDGSMGSAEAWMEEEYQGNPGSFGTHYLDGDALTAIVFEAETRGIPLKLHVNGDAAVDAALDAFEAVAAANGSLTQHHILDHLCLADPDDIVRISTLGLSVSVQPTHYAAANLGETAEYLGEEVFSHAYDYSSFVEGGIPTALGTDWPVWPTTHTLLVAWSSTKTGAERELTMEDALRGYTEGSAAAINRSEDLGRLDVGYLADFVVLSQNPLEVDVDAVPDITVERRFVNGREIH